MPHAAFPKCQAASCHKIVTDKPLDSRFDPAPMICLSDQDAKFATEKLAEGCDRMERLLAGMLDTKGRISEEVHAIRKLGKSLRGGFSLFRLGKSSAKEIQAIGRLLSAPRDAVSRLNTWQKLGWQGDAGPAIFGLLEQQTHSAARRPPPETIEWCVARVIAARRHLRELPPERLPERMGAGLDKLAKQVGKRCRKLKDNGEEDFHDARKALKAYLGAHAFLPPGSVAIDSKMADLPEILGDENDLATLSRWIEEHGFTADFEPTLWEKLSESRSALRKKAIRDAARLSAPE